MENGQKFADLYALLQVESDCSARTLEVAYHFFAKMYHPDNLETANLDKFGEVVQAYKILRDPIARAEYDEQYSSIIGEQKRRFFSSPVDSIDEKTVVSDAEVHGKILLSLYRRRRERASDAGVIQWLLQEALDCSDDQFDFHVWYLKSKGFVEITEQGSLAITIDGVDEVISASRASQPEKLLLAQDTRTEDTA